MKTPFDNFELKITSDVVHQKVETGVELMHKTLPIVIREVSYDCSKLNVNTLIQNAYRLLFQLYIKGIAGTIHQKHIVHRLHPLGKIGYIYTPQWDKEKEKWFVMDEQNKNRVYEQ